MNQKSLVIHATVRQHLCLTNPHASSAENAADSGLLAQCCAGDEYAWKKFFLQYAESIYRWAVFLGLGRQDAEDVVQEVFIRATQQIHRCEAEAAMTAWLYQITRRIAANARRKVWLKRWVQGTSVETSTMEIAFLHDSPGMQEVELLVRQSLANLSPKLAEVYMLIEIEGYTRDEVSKMLGLPLGTVASRLRLAMAQLKRGGVPDVA